ADIPVPLRERLNDGGTQQDKESAPLEVCVQAVRQLGRQIRPMKPSCDGEGTRVPMFRIPHCQEKPLVSSQVPVHQTDTRRQTENPKEIGRTLVKELGKMTP